MCIRKALQYALKNAEERSFLLPSLLMIGLPFLQVRCSQMRGEPTKIPPVRLVGFLDSRGISLSATMLLLLPSLPVVLVIPHSDLIRNSGRKWLYLIQKRVPDFLIAICILHMRCKMSYFTQKASCLRLLIIMQPLCKALTANIFSSQWHDLDSKTKDCSGVWRKEIEHDLWCCPWSLTAISPTWITMSTFPSSTSFVTCFAV